MAPGTNLLRQVSPAHWKETDGRPTSSVFLPREREDGKISVDDGSKTTPADAHALFENGTKSNGDSLYSLGVISVTCKECVDVCLTVTPSPREADERLPSNPFHVTIDFARVVEDLPPQSDWKTKKKKFEKSAVKLHKAAWNPETGRGWLYRPTKPQVARHPTVDMVQKPALLTADIVWVDDRRPGFSFARVFSYVIGVAVLVIAILLVLAWLIARAGSESS